MAGERISWGDLKLVELADNVPVNEGLPDRAALRRHFSDAAVYFSTHPEDHLRYKGDEGAEPAKLDIPLNPAGQDGVALNIPRVPEFELAA